MNLNVVVVIQGREAIPVRAIPLLTDWNFMSPDVVAEVLAGNGGSSVFVFDEPQMGQMRSHRLDNGNVVEVKARWWKSWSTRELRALSVRISTCEPIHEIGYQKWRDESLSVLPPGVFVWKEEFERLHAHNWRVKSNALNRPITDDEEGEKIAQPDPELAVFVREQRGRLDAWSYLDFSPLMNPYIQSVVMEGFEFQKGLQVQTLPLGSPLHQTALTTGCNDAGRLRRMQAMLNRPEELEAGALQDAIEKNATQIKYWEDAPITSVADAAVKQDKLTPLCAERENLAQQHRAMRGDYTEAHPEPKTTALSTETVSAFGSSSTTSAGRAGALVQSPAQGNSTKTRRSDSIDPVIESARSMCSDPEDINQVWPHMQTLADNEKPPFLASTTKGLKYHKNGNDAYLTRDALKKRLQRRNDSRP
jgi:hypothetical protein